MLIFVIATLAAVAPAQRSGAALDVRALPLGTPAILAELDADALKGEPRRLCWSPDGDLLYLQTVDGELPNEQVHHFVLPRSGGVLTEVDAEPFWSVQYWNVKQDRSAPGLPDLAIEVEQKTETIKAGPGPAGTLDRTNPAAATNPALTMPDLVDGTSGNQRAAVVRLKLLGQEIAKWVNEEKPVPGTRFGREAARWCSSASTASSSSSTSGSTRRPCPT